MAVYIFQTTKSSLHLFNKLYAILHHSKEYRSIRHHFKRITLLAKASITLHSILYPSLRNLQTAVRSSARMLLQYLKRHLLWINNISQLTQELSSSTPKSKESLSKFLNHQVPLHSIPFFEHKNQMSFTTCFIAAFILWFSFFATLAFSCRLLFIIYFTLSLFYLFSICSLFLLHFFAFLVSSFPHFLFYFLFYLISLFFHFLFYSSFVYPVFLSFHFLFYPSFVIYFILSFPLVSLSVRNKSCTLIFHYYQNLS